MSSSVLFIDQEHDQMDRDEHLNLLVQKKIQRGEYQQLRHLSCEVNEGCVTLSGVLHSYWLKQIAQAAVQKIPGIQLVKNQIIVMP